ncbi:MAG: hypothetical protein EXX96DRAFT_571423 [Benjaminiella poitrasii]|nr:MAG: hypothetical protein EXX96DRAFT_571423 [Benjaminiella poitrasii]
MLAITKCGLNLLLLGMLYVAFPVLAIYESEAGSYDWHHKWVGHPREAFKIDENHIAVYSEQNIIAALNTENGGIEWRQVLENELDHFVASEAGIFTVSSNPERAQFWNKTTGQLIWEYSLPNEEFFGNTKPIIWNDGQVAAFVDRTKLIKLSNKGEQVWSWTRKRNEEHIWERLMLIQRDGLIYLIVEPDDKEASPYFVIHTIDSQTGETKSTVQVPCSTDYEDISYIGNYLFWTENDLLRWTAIDKVDIKYTSIKSLVSLLPTADKFISTKISLLGNTEDPELKSFVLTTEYELEEQGIMGASVLVYINDETLTLGEYFGEQESFGAFDTLKDLVVYPIRTTSNEIDIRFSSENIQAIKIQDNVNLSGQVNYVKLIDVNPLRIFMVTEGSSVFFYNESSLVWSREEALSAITASEFLDLPEQKMWTQMTDELDESIAEQAAESPLSRYVRRLTTHALELRKLPNWIISHFVGMTGSILKDKNTKVSNLEAQSCWLNKTEPSEMLYRDNFGLRKLLISVTKSGKVIAQDTTRNGKIVWSRYMENYSFNDLHVVRTASVKLPPVIVAIGSAYDPLGGQATGFVRLNALTGEDFVSTIPEASEFFEPMIITNVGVDKVMRLPIEDPEERTHLLTIYEAGSGRVYIYPDTRASRQHFAADFLPNFYFSYQDRQGNMQGFRVVEGYRGSLRAEPLWNFYLPEDETSIGLSHPQPYEKVASLGRALGNRNILYKYLNPHMFAMITKNTEKESIKLRLMDSVKGSVLYEAVHDNVDTTYNEVHIVQSENWFVYHFWSNDVKGRGYRTVVLELYEGANENERIESANFSSFDNVRPHVLSSSFAFPYPVTTMGVTATRNGISTKNVLFGLPTHQMMAVNKRLFDPRRRLTEKPSKEDQEEQLFPYGPIPDDKRLFLTYSLDVARIRTIITSPSLLESTSLVFAYGLDTFFTRSSPSRQFDVLSEDFSKIQLLLTITGLIVGIWVTGPMVRRKRVNALWK